MMIKTADGKRGGHCRSGGSRRTDRRGFAAIFGWAVGRVVGWIAGLGLALALLVGGALPLRAEIWTTASEENFPPYNFTENGKRTGIDTQIIEAVFTAIGVTPVHRVLPWAEVIAAVDMNLVDVAYQFVGNPERFEKYHLIGPHRIGETVFMARADSAIRFNTLEDLRGLRIGVVQGFAYTPEFDKATFLTKEAAANNLINIRLLLARRLDLVVGDRHALAYFVEQDGRLADIRFLAKPLGYVPRYLAMPKARTEKAARFRAALQALQRDGAIQAIIDRWLGCRDTEHGC